MSTETRESPLSYRPSEEAKEILSQLESDDISKSKVIDIALKFLASYNLQEIKEIMDSFIYNKNLLCGKAEESKKKPSLGDHLTQYVKQSKKIG